MLSMTPMYNLFSPGTLWYTQHPSIAGSVKGSSVNPDVPVVELGPGVVKELTIFRWMEIKAIKIQVQVIPSLHTATLRM